MRAAVLWGVAAAAATACGVAVTAASVGAESGDGAEFVWSPAAALERAVDWIQAQGDVAGPLYYVAFLSAWIACLLPASVAEIVPGYLFGLRAGFAVALCGKVIGACVSYMLCRVCCKGAVQRLLLDKQPRLRAVAQAVQEEGLSILLVVRLSYVPVVFKNYGMAALGVAFPQFAVSALVAGAPFAMLWASIGASSRDLAPIMRGERGIHDALPEDNASRAVLAITVLAGLAAAGRVLLEVRARVNAKMDSIEAAGKPASADTTQESTGSLRYVVAAGAVGLVAVALATGGVDVNKIPRPDLQATMKGAVDWIHAQGEMGPLYYTAFLGLWVAALLPCSILEMVPGYLFGFRTGVVVSIVGKNIGTVLSLLLTKYLLRNWLQDRLLARYPILRTLERAVQLEGFPVLVMIRCAYLPMLIKNYGVASLDISIAKIWLASLFASLPFAALWTFVGASATDLGDIFEGKMSARDVLPEDPAPVIAAGAVVGLVFMYALARLAARFKEVLRETEAEQARAAKT